VVVGLATVIIAGMAAAFVAILGCGAPDGPAGDKELRLTCVPEVTWNHTPGDLARDEDGHEVETGTLEGRLKVSDGKRVLVYDAGPLPFRIEAGKRYTFVIDPDSKAIEHVLAGTSQLVWRRTEEEKNTLKYIREEAGTTAAEAESVTREGGPLSSEDRFEVELPDGRTAMITLSQELDFGPTPHIDLKQHCLQAARAKTDVPLEQRKVQVLVDLKACPCGGRNCEAIPVFKEFAIGDLGTVEYTAVPKSKVAPEE